MAARPADPAAPTATAPAVLPSPAVIPVVARPPGLDVPDTPEAHQARVAAAREQARTEALAAIAAGHPEILAGGRPGYDRMIYGRLLHDEMGVTVSNTGCRVSAESLARQETNNEVVTQWIAERYGAQALDSLERRADAIAQRYRGREDEWFEARRVERNRAQRERARQRGSRPSTSTGLLAPTGP